MMDDYMKFLELYMQIMLGTVAFMTIVATLRQTLDTRMPSHQYLVVRYLVEVGLSHVFIAMLALAFVYFEPDPTVALKYTFISIAAYAVPYLIFHLWRRARQKAPTPFHTKVVMLGYIGLSVTVLVTATSFVLPATAELVGFLQTAELIIAYLVWAFLAHIVIFFGFLGSFFNVQDEGKIKDMEVMEVGSRQRADPSPAK